MITFSRLGRYGRLGNQLFQYAMLRGVEASTGFEAVAPEGFAIKGLDLRMPQKNVFPGQMPIFRERGIDFEPAAFGVNDGTDFLGYFQTEKYFEHISANIRKEFSLPPGLMGSVEEKIHGMRDDRPLISCHVRRGDYLVESAVHPVMDVGYYERAASLLPDDLGQPGQARWIVCSDDIAWCRRNLMFLGDVVFSEATGATAALFDLWLMAKCDHHVIANSSLSWWAAWLGNNGHVVAPKRWFGTEGPSGTQADLLPSSWLTT